MTNKHKLNKAIKDLKAVLRAITDECRYKHGCVPEPKFCEEDFCYIFGTDAHVNHEKACKFLWDHGIEADLLEFANTSWPGH